MPRSNLKLPPELDLRKGLHTKLLPETHTEFRILCFKRGLSMQEVIEEFAQACVIGDEVAVKFLDQAADNKRERVPRKFSASDASSILDEIAADSPFR